MTHDDAASEPNPWRAPSHGEIVPGSPAAPEDVLRPEDWPFAGGELVRLKSGGAVLTVVKCFNTRRGELRVEVAHQSDTGPIAMNALPPICLQRADQPAAPMTAPTRRYR